MDNYRIQLVLGNVTQGIMHRVGAALEKNLLKDDYVISITDYTIIINNNEILEKAEKIIKSVDEKILINRTELKDKYRYVFYLEHLDCANCAAKVERICKRNIPNELIVVDFATLKIVIETTKQFEIYDLQIKIQEYAEMVDPHIEVKRTLNKKEKEREFKIDPKKKKIFIIGCSIFLFFFIIKNILKYGLKYDDDFWLYIIIYCGYIPAYILLAKDILYGAFKNIRSGRVFDEMFLMSLATIMALFSGLYDEALFVIIFYRIGELCQQYAVNYSRRSIAGLVDIKQDTAVVEVNGKKTTMNTESIVVGDILNCNAGERIALDGVVVDGVASLDMQALTGESRPVDVKIGSNVLSGSICLEGNLRIKVNKCYEDSLVSKILDTVENAGTLKSKSENFISKFAKYYTPIIVALAVLIATLLPVISGNINWTGENGFKDSLRIAMIFLVVSCPCALVISIPLSFFGGIGGASKSGILIKGSNYLEALNNVKTVVFDKTGTLSKGNFIITKVVSTSSYTDKEILRYAAFAETTSNHVIAKSIIKAYNKVIDTSVVQSINTSNKQGIVAKVEDKIISIGRKMFMENQKIKNLVEIKDEEVMYVAFDNKCVGYLVIEDELREEAYFVIRKLREYGINNIVMLTGDGEKVTQNVAEKLNIKEYYYNINPIEKVDLLTKIKEKYSDGKVIFIGDGINDAPVISVADVGIAMGELGSEIAIQTADIVFMKDDLKKLLQALEIAKKTKDIIIENIILALFVKFIVLFIAPLNISSFINIFLVYFAIFADVGVSLLAVLNSLRARKVGEIK